MGVTLDEVKLVDVVVVSYNSRDILRSCVAPLAAIDDLRVTIVDNASSDGSLDSVADLPLRTIAMNENAGFAAGCNAGWRAGEAPVVLFLNPDATIALKSVLHLASTFERLPRVGAVAPKIVDANGVLHHSQRRFPRVRSTYAQALFLHRLFPRMTWSDEVDRDPAHYSHPRSVEWVSGAALMVHRRVLEALNGWDDSYFHYGEDKDLCRRIWDLGYEVRYEPQAVATHEGGASAPRTRLLPLLAANRVRFALKHRGRAAALLERGGIALSCVTHMLVGRGGRTARRGYAGALKTALTPLEPAASQMTRLA